MTMGSVTKPEQQSTIHKKRQSNRIEIRNVPSHVTQQDLEVLVKNWGTVKKVHQVANDSEPYYTVIFDTPEEAQSAYENLNEYELEGCNLKVEITNNNPASGKLVNNFRGPRNMGHNPASNLIGGNRPVRNGGGCPLRILVPSDFVGAIIGRKGQTIKNITQKCKARVDVHGKENNGVMDKISDKVVISIYGQPENCTNACKEILQVLQQESTNNNRGDVLLKMLANDRFCGRIIGKEGKMIKKIKEETGTKIAVSNAQEMAALFPDRVIAIKGTLEGMSQAESAISAKLAECIEQDQAQSFHGGMMIPHGPMGPNYFYPNNRVFDGPGFYNHPPHPLLHPHLHGGFHPHPGPNFTHPVGGPGVIQNESLHISVPNTAVGALIGTGGATIKQMMRGSMAFINIESKKEGDTSLERVVIIKGFPDSCWRAAFMVFEKMKMEGFAGFDEVRLKTCIEVPKILVGRVIGKAGKNVRELQRLTGALIKLPEDPNSQGEQVAVDVFGNFYATRNAVSRIRNMMIQSQMKGAFNNHQQLPNSQPNLQRQSSQEPQQLELQQQQLQTGNSNNSEPQTEGEGDVVQKC